MLSVCVCVCVCVCVSVCTCTNIPFKRLYEVTSLHTLLCMLCYEGHLYLTLFIVIQLVIISMAGIASKVGITIVQSVIQCSNVMHGIGYLKNVQLEGQHDSCIRYVFNLRLGGST